LYLVNMDVYIMWYYSNIDFFLLIECSMIYLCLMFLIYKDLSLYIDLFDYWFYVIFILVYSDLYLLIFRLFLVN